jgi:hypothetical protein
MERGLVQPNQGVFSRWAGCNLTEAGVLEAEAVNTMAKLPQS